VLERVDPHRVVLATQSALLVIAAALATLTLTGAIEIWQVYVLSVIAGVVMVLDSPGRQALTFALVGREDLSAATGLTTTVFSVGRVVGPATGGLLVAWIGTGGCFVVNVVSFVPALATLLLVRRNRLFLTARESGQRTSVLRSTRDTVAYVRHTPRVAVILAAIFLLSTLSSNVNVLVPLLAKQTLHGGPETFGVISACLGIGTIAGGLSAAARGRASFRTLLGAGAGMGVAELVIAAHASVLTAAILLFALGTCYTLWTSNASATLQLAAPDHQQGRAVSLYFFAFLAGSPIGGWFSGELIAHGGARLGFGVAGAAALATVTLGMLRLSALDRRAAI
jgi:predicted MFS family arabinose efflux permease